MKKTIILLLLVVCINTFSQETRSTNIQMKEVEVTSKGNSSSGNGPGSSNRPDKPSVTETTPLASVPSEIIKNASPATIDGLRRLKALSYFMKFMKYLTAMNVFNTLMITENPDKIPELMNAMTPDYWKDVKNHLNSLKTFQTGVIDRIVTDTREGIDHQISEKKQKNENTKSLEIEKKFWGNFNYIARNLFNKKSYNDYLNNDKDKKTPNPFQVKLEGEIISEIRHNVISFDIENVSAYGKEGLTIKPEFTIVNAANHNGYDIYLICSFAFDDGKFLKDFNDSFKDLEGNVCVSAQLNPCCNSTIYNSDNPIFPELFIPYSELHLDPETTEHLINIFVEIRVDGRSIGKRYLDNFKVIFK